MPSWISGSTSAWTCSPRSSLHRLLHHLRVELEADGGDVPDCCLPSRLPAPRISRSCAASRKPPPRSSSSCSTRSRFCASARDQVLAGDQEVGVGALVRAADAAAQLVELRQAEVVGAVDDDGVGARDVEPGLDDRRADQHVRPRACMKCEHRPSRASRSPICPCATAMRASGTSSRRRRAMRVDVLDPVVDEEHLPAARRARAGWRRG